MRNFLIWTLVGVCGLGLIFDGSIRNDYYTAFSYCNFFVIKCSPPIPNSTRTSLIPLGLWLALLWPCLSSMYSVDCYSSCFLSSALSFIRLWLIRISLSIHPLTSGNKLRQSPLTLLCFLYAWILSLLKSSRCKPYKKEKEQEGLSKQQKSKLRKFLNNKRLKNKNQLQVKVKAMKNPNMIRRNKKATKSKRNNDFV